MTDAQFTIARLYGFASWPKLKAHIDSLEAVGQLKEAIDTNDIDRVKTIMTRTPTLHSAPLGYGKDGPLTWVAECRIPWEPPSPATLAMAAWMLEHGSDVHQGGDGPLMRAAILQQSLCSSTVEQMSMPAPQSMRPASAGRLQYFMQRPNPSFETPKPCSGNIPHNVV